MALILMAVWDTEENQRTKHTVLTLQNLLHSVDRKTHRIVIIDNGSCKRTADLLDASGLEIIHLTDNIGQARALNKGIALREPGEIVIRMDNDIVVWQTSWVENMEYVIKKDPSIALVSLKRTSAWEHPDNPDPAFRSRLEMLPHEDGEPWTVIEVADSVLGTCQAISPAFLDQIGYLYQMGSKWGFIDPILCAKAHALGYKTVYLPHVPIEYLEKDEGTPYQLWKQEQARELFPRFEKLKQEILAGNKIYNGPGDE